MSVWMLRDLPQAHKRTGSRGIEPCRRSNLVRVRLALTLILCAVILPGVVFSQAGKKSNHDNKITEKPLLKNIRHLSSKNYTRVVMDLSSEVKYETHILKGDASKGLPLRVYVDLFGIQLAMSSDDPILVRDGLLRRVRVGQYRPNVVRVVLDLNDMRSHKAFLLPDPYRLVVDVHGPRDGQKLAAIEKKSRESQTLPKSKLIRKRLCKIVLDPGHGGKDPGASSVRGLEEKDVVLSIAKKLAKKLRKEMGCKVILTRNDDSFLHLEDRTAIANAEGADLFISLHTNSSSNRKLRGVETYYLNATDDEAAIRLAARENGTSRRKISDLQFILSDLTQNSKLEDSISLAHHLQSSVVSNVRKKYGKVKDLGVKKAFFYVLVGAKMPCVLAELFFISHKVEGRSLAQRAYQNTIVKALFQGIKEYHESTLVVKNL